MTTIDKYFARKTLMSLLKTLIALAGMFVIIDLLTHRREHIMKYDVEWYIVVKYYLLYLPSIVSSIAPLAMLISALLVLGSAAQNNEITASLASGISLKRQMAMPVLVALAFAGIIFLSDEWAGAAAMKKATDIEHRYFSRNPDTKRSGIDWPVLEGGWSCHIRKFNRTALTGEGVLMYATHENQFEQITAERIFWDELSREWQLEKGLWLAFDEDSAEKAMQKRITQMPAPIKETPAVLFALDQDPHTKNAWQLRQDIHRAERLGMPTKNILVDFHTRFARPALCFIMIGLAIPFAIRLRRGGLAIGFGISLVIAISYLILYEIGKGLGYLDVLSPVFAAWFANIIFTAISLVLFARTPT